MALSLRVRVSWLGDVIHEEILAPPRDFTLGENDSDFVMPEAVLGRRKFPVVRIRDGRVRVGVLLRDFSVVTAVEPDPDDAGIGFFEVTLGQRFAQSFGDFVVDVAAEPRVRSPVRRFFVRLGGLGYFGGALSFGAGVLGSAAHFAPPPEVWVEETRKDQLYLIQHYLAASAERERLAGAGDTGGRGELRSGRRDGRGRRGFAPTRGRTGGSGSRSARSLAISEALEFGMIGLVSEPSLGGDPASARGAPWGRDLGGDDTGGNSGQAPYGDDFSDHGVNPVVDARKDALSTFAIDVDTGSYFFVKRRLDEGSLPPLAAVRPEEMLNAFDYGYPGPEAPSDARPFRVELDAAPSPFDAKRHFIRVAIQGRRVDESARPPVHLTYLVDTSGSMQGADRLELAQRCLRLLTQRLKPGDTVALSTYAGAVREVLPPTGVERRASILAAIDELSAGGSTAMASGIELAYRLAAQSQRRGHESRVIVLSDGDANVGPMEPDAILRLIESERRKGITLSTVGFGRGNYHDSTMERLADAGDGNYSYVGSEGDAARVFGRALGGMLQVIARDVKIQVEMNPEAVSEYRLIGYENRDVADGDFRKDEVDGGEIGAGHAVTALYDVVLRNSALSPISVSLRHKPAAEGPSARALESRFSLAPARILGSFASAPASFRFAVSVAALGEVLRGSPHALGWQLADVAELAEASSEGDEDREELVRLARIAADLRGG